MSRTLVELAGKAGPGVWKRSQSYLCIYITLKIVIYSSQASTVCLEELFKNADSVCLRSSRSEKVLPTGLVQFAGCADVQMVPASVLETW